MRLIVGANSMIGSALLRDLHARGYPGVGTGRNRADSIHAYLDLTEEGGEKVLPGADFVYICAAVARLEACFRNPKESYAVNVEGAFRMAREMRARGAHVVFLSTNQVFSGRIPFQGPSGPRLPQTEYGRQKAEAEERILGLGAGVTILRLTKVFDDVPGLVVKWLTALSQGNAIEAFTDMTLAPVLLADVIELCMELPNSPAYSIVQMSGPEDITYYEFARKIAVCAGFDPDLVCPVLVRESLVLSEIPPRYTSLNSDLAGAILGRGFPGVDRVVEELIKNVRETERML